MELEEEAKSTTITDIDPNYFKEFSNHILKEKFSTHQYVQDMREVLSTRLLTGQERDECIKIDQQFDQERKTLDMIKAGSLIINWKLIPNLYFDIHTVTNVQQFIQFLCYKGNIKFDDISQCNRPLQRL